MNKKILKCITVAAIALVMTASVAYAAVAHAHDSGVPDCTQHSMKKTCWGSTTHIDTSTRDDAWGYTRARFESLGRVYGDTQRNVGFGSSYADTDYDQDISGSHYCAEKDLIKGVTYYGTASAPSGALTKSIDNIGTVAYRVDVETGETTIIVGGEK